MGTAADCIAAAPRGRSKSMPEQKPYVLIVDDDRDIVRMLTSILSEYQVLTANNGAEALDVLQRHPVDVVVADQMMPGLTG